MVEGGEEGGGGGGGGLVCILLFFGYFLFGCGASYCKVNDTVTLISLCI